MIAAQGFSGRYTMHNQQGGIVTLALSQDAQGKIVGTLSGNGVSFQVEGTLEGNSAVGAIFSNQGGMYFQADLQGARLVVTIVGVGPDNEPDYSQTEEWAFTRQNGGVAAQPESAGPLGGSVSGAVASGVDAALGTFSNGTMTIQLQGAKGTYSGIASLQGQQYAVAAKGTGAQLTGTYTADGTSYPWTAAIQGDLMTMSVDGQTIHLQRQGGGVAAGAQPANARPAQGVRPEPQHSQLSAQGQQWDQWFRGKRLTQMSSYSSSGGSGGYSSHNTWDLCRDGRFFFSGSSSVSVDVGGASGYNGAQDAGAGQWRIVEQGPVGGVELRWAGGQVTQHRLEYQDQATYIDGTRTYVTEDNTSC
ncbi:MAG TPA: hypothetical protein VGA37_11245 [Gemmatimonadales bacterium]